METPKIVSRTLANPEKVSRGRDMSGLRNWSSQSRIMGTVMLILGWFTIPAEVFLRRKFGYRWFTPINFLAGFVLLSAVEMLQYVWEAVPYWLAHVESSLNPFYSKDRVLDYNGTRLMNFIYAFYVYIGIFQLMKRWWRKKTDTHLHSYDDGTSRLQFLGGILKVIINEIMEPTLGFLFYISRARKRGVEYVPEFIHDKAAFTNTIIEPLVFFAAGYYCPFPVIKYWLFITALAVAVYANMKEATKQGKVLDLKDSMLEAKAMAELRKGKQEQGKKPKEQTKAKPKEKEPEMIPIEERVSNVPINRRDLKSIIEEMHTEKNSERDAKLATIVHQLQSLQ